ncbi:E3 ubiquitin-protein ligase rad18, partial [Ascosphaera aggregata]
MAEPPSFDIPDTTDWLPTPLHKLSALEAALRCQICKDFFTNPVITSCSHTFCSLCIRRCLSTEGKCPACRCPDQAIKLRCNWAVQEGVDAWVRARKEVLNVAREVGSHGGAQREILHDELSPGIKRRSDEDASQVGTAISEGKKRLRSSTRSKPVTYSYYDTTLSDASRNIDDGTLETEHIASAPAPLPQTNPEPEPEPNDGLVACPICSRRMRPALVFSHLDRCPGPFSQGQETNKSVISSKSSPKSSPFPFSSTPRHLPPTPERLPALNYTLLSDKTLRQKLSALGIPSWGSKQLLQRRHTEWINLWNANCDSRYPKSKRDLLHELDLWERTQGSTNGNGNVHRVDVSRKDFDKENWGKGHQESFRGLIEQARRGTEKNKSQSTETAGPDLVEPMSLDATPNPPTPEAHGQNDQITQDHSRLREQQASPMPSPLSSARPVDPIEVDTPQPSTVRPLAQPPPPAPMSDLQTPYTNSPHVSGHLSGIIACRPSNQQQPTTCTRPTSFAQSVDPIEFVSPQARRGSDSHGKEAQDCVGHQEERQRQQQAMPMPSPISFARSVDPIGVSPTSEVDETVQQSPENGTLDRVP